MGWFWALLQRNVLNQRNWASRDELRYAIGAARILWTVESHDLDHLLGHHT